MADDIPANVRSQVNERDGGACRWCGSYAAEGQRGLHHIAYRSEGGLHVPENLVTLHDFYWPYCHPYVHRHKRVIQPILAEVVKHGGINGLQLLRWYTERVA